MRVLLGLNKHSGSNLFGSRFLAHWTEPVRVLAYYANSSCLPCVDWMLDAVYGNVQAFSPSFFQNEFGLSFVPPVSERLTKLIIDDLIEWEPELVISDAEPFSVALAQVLEVPLIYCSPLFLLTGTVDLKPAKLSSFAWLKTKLEKLPETEYPKLVYSPLGDITTNIELKPGYEWISPYSIAPNGTGKLLTSPGILDNLVIDDNTTVVTNGETSFVADAIYHNRRLLISPSHNDSEQELNAHLYSWLGYGINLGNPRSLSWVKSRIDQECKPFTVKSKKGMMLHEKLATL